MSARRLWSPADMKKAGRLRRAGKTLEQIGRALNRSPASVNSALKRLKSENDAKKIPCMCCGLRFTSAGPHNRLCGRCARQSISPYAL